jgi:hypothetical protein
MMEALWCNVHGELVGRFCVAKRCTRGCCNNSRQSIRGRSTRDTFCQCFIVIGQTARQLALSVFLLGSIGSLINAQEPLAASARKPALLLGAAWYPEQWQESRWEADLTMMEAAHINFVRIGEFAWSTIEPSEGNYKLDWIEHAIRAAERHHIAVVLGTP